MVQLLSKPRSPSTDVDQQVVAILTRSAAHPKSTPAAHPRRAHAVGPRAGVRVHAIRGVVVLEVAGRLSAVVEELDLAIQTALAEGPRGVVCDLSAVHEGDEPAAAGMLATAGRHVCSWPGVPLGVACPDPAIRKVLRAHPVGRHLIVAESLFSAVSAVLAAPVVAVQSLRLPPHPTSPRASRTFVTRTLLDWRLNHVIPFATLVVSELVASSMNVGTDINLSVAWSLGALRLTVQDGGPAQPDGCEPGSGLNGRGRTVVAGLSRAFGVLPTASTGKVVWAVLDAPRRPQSLKSDRTSQRWNR
jgi:hypothetical protein